MLSSNGSGCCERKVAEEELGGNEDSTGIDSASSRVCSLIEGVCAGARHRGERNLKVLALSDHVVAEKAAAASENLACRETTVLGWALRSWQWPMWFVRCLLFVCNMLLCE